MLANVFLGRVLRVDAWAHYQGVRVGSLLITQTAKKIDKK
jgi:hypothetical protein